MPGRTASQAIRNHCLVLEELSQALGFASFCQAKEEIICSIASENLILTGTFREGVRPLNITELFARKDIRRF
jgi:hypothetical protein